TLFATDSTFSFQVGAGTGDVLSIDTQMVSPTALGLLPDFVGEAFTHFEHNGKLYEMEMGAYTLAHGGADVPSKLDPSELAAMYGTTVADISFHRLIRDTGEV